MLKGHVFKKQIFGNQIFALFIDMFLKGKCGISGEYKEKMNISYNNNTLTVASGVACIRGRFLEEDTNSEINAGNELSYCRLVIEIDLSKENTEEEFEQAKYKVIKGTNSYPNLTQTNIIANNSGIYQYELAQFKTSANGITDFVDKRNYLDFNSIYAEIEHEYRVILTSLQKELADVKDGSDYLLKSSGGTVKGKTIFEGGIEGNVKGNLQGNASSATNSHTARKRQ